MPTRDNKGWTPLHDAVSENDFATVEVLLKGGADANAKTNLGATPLYYAVSKNASATVEVLLKAGADANAKDSDGYSRCTRRR